MEIIETEKPRGPGRPVGSKSKTTLEMRDHARFWGDKALQKLVESIDHEDPRVALDAAKSLLDRGFGKPTQTTVIQGDEDGGAVRLTAIERTVIDPVNASVTQLKLINGS